MWDKEREKDKRKRGTGRGRRRGKGWKRKEKWEEVIGRISQEILLSELLLVFFFLLNT